MKKERLARGVYRRGNSVLIYVTDPDGRGHFKSLGQVSVSLAKSQRVIEQRKIAEGRYVKPAPRIERVRFSFIADAELERVKRTKRFWDSGWSRIERFKRWFAGRFADDITSRELDARMRVELAERSPATWNEYRTTVLQIYARYMKLAVSENLEQKQRHLDPIRQELAVNPAQGLERKHLENSRDPKLSFADEDRLRAAIRELFPEKMPEFDLALHTGMRASNMYGTHGSKRKQFEPLQWTAVNLDFKVITLPRSKAGPGYFVPLNRTAVAALNILRERSDGTGAVLRKPSGLEIHSSRKWFTQCVAKAALGNFTWHDLRHIFGTRLRANRVPFEDIVQLLGHNLRSMTARYAKPDMGRLHEAVATLDRGETQTSTKTDTPPVLAFSAKKSA